MKQALIKFIITVLIVSLFCYVSKLCYLPETHSPIVLMWIGIAICLFRMWKYHFCWPRGRYNGKRIDGFEVKFQLHLLWWRFKPVIHLRHGRYYVIWLCFSIRGEASYKD